MFAALNLETEYLTLDRIPGLVASWIQLVGIVSMVVLAVGELIRHASGKGSLLFHGLAGQLSDLDEQQAWKVRALRLLIALTLLGLLATFGTYVWGLYLANNSERGTASAHLIFTFACATAILAVSWEFLLDLFRLSGRRVWAIARLSVKEAIRHKVLWSFTVLLAVFLFASWFYSSDRPEDQWRTYVSLVFFVMTGLLLLTASVLACFSLPTDIRQQTIHTVVTKPVYRFELVLGRIIGFGFLMTAVLGVMAHLSLLYVFRGIDPTARETSVRARVPLYGSLHFEELNEQGEYVRRLRGDDVGREWGYHQYIRGGSTQEAVWQFPSAPAGFAGTDRMVPVEFNFDIFRTSKGGDIDPQQGVSCQVKFINKNKWRLDRYTKYREEVDARTQLRSEQERARDYGYYELPTPIQVVDYQTYTIFFPAALLEDLGPEGLEIRVSCRDTNQYLGMAPRDLYILADEASFYLNYLKGAVGIWFLMMLVIILGVVFSTYLSALVGLLLTWMVIMGGVPAVRGLVESMARQQPPTTTSPLESSGPTEAMYRLVRGDPPTTPLEQTRGVWVIRKSDNLFRYVYRGLSNVLPDLGQYYRSVFVEEGFNIPLDELFATFLLLLGYVFPFLVAAYYLLNAREVAQ
jgi:ABC-type transport system involved in multi-copper enzyme maturation permease subunit